jgi:hypothetical protein
LSLLRLTVGLLSLPFGPSRLAGLSRLRRVSEPSCTGAACRYYGLC